jgi:purine-binding chemotaxis protein CheW
MTAASPRETIFGSFYLGDSEFALSVAHVQEVVNPCAAYTPVPLAPDYLRGIFNLRGTIVPVVDLRRLLELPGEPAAEGQKVAIVEHDETCIGLLFDRTGEIFRDNRDERSDLERSASGVVSGVFKKADGRRLVQVLDIPALFALKGVPRQTGAASADGQQRQRRGQRRQCISFRVGPSTCALGIDTIQEILKVDRVVESVFAVDHCIGTIDLRGAVVPVIDLASLLQYRAPDRSAEATAGARRVIVMRLRDELFGLLVDAVDSLVPYFPDEVMHFPILNRERAEMFAGCIARPEGDILLLDHAKVLFEHEVDEITQGHSALYQAAAGRQAERKHQSGTRRTYITFAIDSTYAVGINDVREILDQPPTLLHPPGLPDHVRGLVNLRGELVAIVDARRLYGKGEAPAHGKVLVFKGQRVHFGLVVDSVEAIVAFADSDKVKLPELFYKGGGIGAEDVQEAVEVRDQHGTRRNMLLLNPQSLADRIERAFAA